MPHPDPDHRPGFKPSEARTLRRWIIGMLTASTIVILISPFTNEAFDRVFAVLTAATTATGAVVIRRPTGMRVILGVTAVVYALMATGLLGI